MKPKVVYWNNIPAPYMVERFNVLADRGNMDFEAWFNERTHSDRSWEVEEEKWRFPYQYMPSLNIFGRRFRFPLPLFRGKLPDVLTSLYAEPVFLIGWIIAKLRGVRTAFWCQVTTDRWVKRREWKNKIKRLVFLRVDATFGSGEESRIFAMRYGTPDNRAFCLRHSIDVEHYTKGRQKVLPERGNIRKKLGLHGIVFIYVGRLWWGKGVNYLLDAFRDLQNRIDREISLLIVGDGVDEVALKEQCRSEGVRNVVFAGFKQKAELPRYYAASDVFVFPTLGDPYGLVIDEAMASCLPVISTSSAGEIRDRIEDGVNGYIVPPEDSLALCNAMEKLVFDSQRRTEMGKASMKKIAGHTHEQWAKDFELLIQCVMSQGELNK